MFNDNYTTFNRWLLFFGFIVALLFVSYDYGLIEILINNDKSYLSLAIIVFFVISSFYVGYLSYRLGTETRLSIELTKKAKQGDVLFSPLCSVAQIADPDMSPSYAKDHVELLANKVLVSGKMSGHDALLDRLDNKIRRGHETGWFISDLMVRLGLLGTVIGFILMLGSLTTVSSIDLQTLQKLLTQMTAGMQVALYTTLSGLTAGILLSFQYQLLDQGANRLMSDIIELSEVHILRHLTNLGGSSNVS